MLQDRDSLMKATLDELAKVRRAVLLRMFINSLTRGGPGGTPKPIELSSHDPIRYCIEFLRCELRVSAAKSVLFLSVSVN